MPRYNQEVKKYDKLIGQKILFRRKQIGLTIEQLAKKINVSAQQLYK
jgi:transcriptional regulator with XRE-family HTH domain